MGRRNSSGGEKQEKKSPIKIKPIPRKHAGKITAPWALMERLIAEVSEFAHLKVAKIKLWWQKDWKADVDGIAIGAQVCKASEVDRNLVEESSGETVDLFIKLPEKVWPTLNDTEKEHRMFHELCHIMPALNANGDQKRDSKDRLLWRLRKHPITAFHEELERFGIERVIGHNSAILTSIESADRPMEKIFDESEKKAADNSSGWQELSIHELGLPELIAKKVTDAGHLTIGKLSKLMNDHGQWWPKEIPGIGEASGEKIENAFANFWKKHPEYTASNAAA